MDFKKATKAMFEKGAAIRLSSWPPSRRYERGDVGSGFFLNKEDGVIDVCIGRQSRIWSFDEINSDDWEIYKPKAPLLAKEQSFTHALLALKHGMEIMPKLTCKNWVSAIDLMTTKILPAKIRRPHWMPRYFYIMHKGVIIPFDNDTNVMPCEECDELFGSEDVLANDWEIHAAE